jgi:hypothetical protein
MPTCSVQIGGRAKSGRMSATCPAREIIGCSREPSRCASRPPWALVPARGHGVAPAIDYSVSLGMRGLCPGTPSKNKIGLPPIFGRCASSQTGRYPLRFSSCSPGNAIRCLALGPRRVRRPRGRAAQKDCRGAHPRNGWADANKSTCPVKAPIHTVPTTSPLRAIFWQPPKLSEFGALFMRSELAPRSGSL